MGIDPSYVVGFEPTSPAGAAGASSGVKVRKFNSKTGELED